MEQNSYKTVFFFIVSLSTVYIKPSNNYHLITVKNEVVPSIIKWPKITSVNKPLEFTNSSLVTKRSLYRKHIIPFQKYLGLTQKPILIYEKKFSDPNAFVFFREDPNAPHLIIVPSPAKKNIPTIFHELVHIYLEYKKRSILKNHFSQLRYFIPIVMKSILLQQFEEPFFNLISVGYFALGLYFFVTQKTKHHQFEEIICDSYASLVFKDPRKTTSLIDQDINYFENDLNHRTNVFFIDNFYGSTHPSHKKRLNHLKKMKVLVNKNQREKIKEWISNIEDYLLNNLSPMHFMFGIPDLT
jgi:hypothetical protein